jgi:hypothetical protein
MSKSILFYQQTWDSFRTAQAAGEMEKSGRLVSFQDAKQVSPEECATKMIELLSKTTREEQGGKFINIDGSIIPW